MEADWHELVRGHDRDRTGLARPPALDFFSAACRADATRFGIVWEWNTASCRVLAKVGFTETGLKEVDAVYGTTLFTTRRL